MSNEVNSEIQELVSDHKSLRDDFKELIIMAKEVEVKCVDPDVPKEISTFLLRFWVTIEALIQKEEGIIFPLILDDRVDESYGDIQEVLAIHRCFEKELQPLIDEVLNYEVATKSCDLWKSLVKRTRLFVEDLQDHVKKEDHFLKKSIVIFDSESIDELDLELELELEVS